MYIITVHNEPNEYYSLVGTFRNVVESFEELSETSLTNTFFLPGTRKLAYEFQMFNKSQNSSTS